MIDPAYESRLERYRLAWESGRFDQLIPAFMLCTAAGLPLPAWLGEAALDDLQFAYSTRKRGDRHARTGAVQDHWNTVHQTRHRMVQAVLSQQQWEIDMGLRRAPPNKDDAAEIVRKILTRKNAEHVARGSKEAILDSYNSLENKED